jgi:hypothetical protein
VRPSSQGAYRIAINAAGESEITVRAGEVEVFAPSGSQLVGSAVQSQGVSFFQPQQQQPQQLA